MALVTCEECFEVVGNPDQYLTHKTKEHRAFADCSDKLQAQALEILGEQLLDAYLEAMEEQAEERLLEIVKQLEEGYYL